MRKCIAKQDDLELWFTTYNASFKYILFKKCKYFKQEVCRSMVLGNAFKKHLKTSTLDHARAMMHGLKYTSKKFKA